MLCVPQDKVEALVLATLVYNYFYYVHLGAGHHRRQPRQDPTVQHDLAVSLEDIYKGCVKKMKITRYVLFSPHYYESLVLICNKVIFSGRLVVFYVLTLSVSCV